MFKINFEGVNVEDYFDEDSAVPVAVDRWYFRKDRSWVVQLKDRLGNQIGEAAYFGNKEEAIDEENRLRTIYKL